MISEQSPPSQALSRNKDSRLVWCGWVLLLAVFVWLYRPTFEWLINYWRKDEYYAHGPLLPFISAALVYMKRDALIKAWNERPRQASFPSGLIFLALLMQLFGSVAEINTVRAVQAFSIPVLCLGAARYFAGKAFEKELRFPALFLFLGVPMTGPMIETLTLPMQNYAASASAIILGLFGMPINREGVNIYTPLYHFVVAVPCSGLKITITLFTMGVLIAHLMPKLNQFQRCVLAFLSIPVALLANTSRVMSIVLLGYNFGTKVAEGFLHSWSGLFMFSLSLALLISAGNFMVRTTETKNQIPPIVPDAAEPTKVSVSELPPIIVSPSTAEPAVAAPTTASPLTHTPKTATPTITSNSTSSSNPLTIDLAAP